VNFTDENILSVYTEGVTVGKKDLKKTKKYDDVSFIPTELPMVLIPSVNSSVNCSHLLNIVHHVNYKWNHRQNCLSVFSRELWNCSFLNWTVNYCSLQMKSSTDWKVVDAILEGFWIFLLNWIFKLNISDKITNRLKSRRWYLMVSEIFLLNWKFKLNITDGITEEMVKNIII
jgi:hypothetical protein